MLNPNQKRALRVTLEVVEDELRYLTELSHNHEEGLFSYLMDDLAENEKHLLDEKIESLNGHLGYLKGLFGLGQKELVLRWIVKATAAYLSIQLEEVMSDQLKGYGEVAEELEQTLDPILNQMRSILREMESIV
jgi:hypothetical protein